MEGALDETWMSVYQRVFLLFKDRDCISRFALQLNVAT